MFFCPSVWFPFLWLWTQIRPEARAVDGGYYQSQRVSGCAPSVRFASSLALHAPFPSFLSRICVSAASIAGGSKTLHRNSAGSNNYCSCGVSTPQEPCPCESGPSSGLLCCRRCVPIYLCGSRPQQQNPETASEAPGRSASSVAQKGTSELAATCMKTWVWSINLRDQNVVLGAKILFHLANISGILCLVIGFSEEILTCLRHRYYCHTKMVQSEFIATVVWDGN